VSKLRLTVVLGKILCGKDELLLWNRSIWITVGCVEREHDQLAIDLDRLFFIDTIEHDPTPKTADSFLSGLAEDRVGPNIGHPTRYLRFLFCGQTKGVAQVESRTSRHASEKHDQRSDLGNRAFCGRG